MRKWQKIVDFSGKANLPAMTVKFSHRHTIQALKRIYLHCTIPVMLRNALMMRNNL